jgi:hypothetical protein
VLTCREAIARLTFLEQGELALPDERATKRHLAACEGCLPYWRTYRATVVLERQAYAAEGRIGLEVPEDFARRVLAAARNLTGFLTSARHAIILLSGVAAAPLLAFFLR